jgi:predicted permease
VASDLGYAVRALGRSPGFTAVSVLCLALGIGANTAIFSLLDAVLLRPLPVEDPQRLVVLESADASGRGGSSFSYPLFHHLRQHATAAADVFAYGRVDVNLSAGGLTDAPAGLVVSDNYFSTLGVRPALGRAFAAADEAAVVVSHRYWKRRFHSDRAIVGRSVTLNGTPFAIVGVAPAGFFGTEVGRSPDLFVPLALRDQLFPGSTRLQAPNSFWLRAMARLAPGVEMPPAAAQLQAVYRQYVAGVGGRVSAGLQRNLENRRIALTPGARGPFGLGPQFGTPLRILMATAGAVLLIAYANVAALLLARGAARRREIAIRLALGAGRGRIVRQLLTESTILAAAGGAAGVIVGMWSANTLTTFLADRIVEVTLDTRMLAFTVLTSAVTAALFGAAPAMRSTRADVTPSLKATTSAARERRIGRVLVPAQVALTLLLLIGAGLFTRTLANLRSMDSGFRADDVVIATVNPGLNRYPAEKLKAFYSTLVARAAALPGVHWATLADAPLLGSTYVDGLTVPGVDGMAEVSLRFVDPRFFDAMSIRRLAGRDFTDADTASSARVAIVNETIVRKYFGGRNPIGARIGVDGAAAEVVGVIADTRYRGLRDPVPNTVYVPLSQARFVGTERTLHVRASNPAATVAAIRNEIRALDRTLPANVRPFSQLVDVNLERERLVAMLCAVFAALAVLLTSTGLYGVIAYDVTRRTREIGIRVSLGAQPSAVVWMVLGDTLIAITAGVAAGVPLSWWLSRAIRAQLYGISAHDPITLAGAAGVLLAAGLVAGYLPARRASRVDPVVSLRQE